MNLLRSASIVSLLTLASRITGLARELVFAAAFGANASTDAFNVAFRIPNLLRRLFAEGAFSQAFVPLLAATRAAEGDEVTRRLVNAVGTVLAWALLLTVIVGVIGSPVVVWMMASGLRDSGSFDEAVVMTRIMFPYIGCMSMVALSAGVLNTWKHFAVPAATPVLLNLCVISAALLLGPWFRSLGINPVYAMAVGVMIGGVVQLAVQVPALARLGMVPRIGVSLRGLREAWHHPGVHRVLRQMAPALLGVSVAQISLLINTQIASHQSVGAVSWLAYADRLMDFPTGLLGVALGVVILPQLAATQAKGDVAGYSALLDWGLRLVVLLAMPCAAALAVFAEPLVATLYHYGRFTAVDVAQTVRALIPYGIGLMGIVSVKVLAPGFYAKQDIRTPVKIAIGVLVLTQLLNLVFVPWLGHAGLNVSLAVGQTVNALWLLLGLKHRGSYSPGPGWGRFVLQAGVATAALTAGLWWASQALDWVALGASGKWARIGWLAASLGGAGLIYFVVLALTGLKLKSFVRRV